MKHALPQRVTLEAALIVRSWGICDGLHLSPQCTETKRQKYARRSFNLLPDWQDKRLIAAIIALVYSYSTAGSIVEVRWR